MIQKIKSYLLPIVAMLTLASPSLVPLAVSADCGTSNIGPNVSQGASDAAGNNIGCSDTGTGASSTIGHIASTVVGIFSVVVGAAAVIMIIYSGFRYITSGGDSGRVGSAKNSLIYAIIGLVVVAIAQLIVHYVLSQANSLT
jgi:Type IV secretion system pilin